MAEPDNRYGRDRPIEPSKTALLSVDVQNGTLGDKDRESRPYFHQQATRITIPNIQKLQVACRRVGIEVMFTVIESLTLDGRDRSLDYKITGYHFPKGSHEARVLPQIAPQGDEIVLPKTSSGLFNSTIFDYLLRNIGIDTVLVTGFLTDQCIDMTLRDGADRSFYMVCVSDACNTESEARHVQALAAFKGYCRIMSTPEILLELERLPDAGECRAP